MQYLRQKKGGLSVGVV